MLQDLGGGNLSHAYLFTGQEGVGKTAIARWFASELLSQNVEASQQEQVRHMVDKLHHPDILVLDELWIEEQNEDWEQISKYSNAPQRHREKPPKSRSNSIGIDDVRALQERLADTGSGTYRVCIITHAERMREEAANALLKSLEEPLPGRVFILTASSPKQLLPTIISRVRTMQFSPVPTSELRQLLSGEDEETSQFLLSIAAGAPGRIVRLLHDRELLLHERMLHTQAASFWHASSLHDRLKSLEPLVKKGQDADRFFAHLMASLHMLPASQRPSLTAWQQLESGLRTNANRDLIVQRFALAATSETR